VLTDVEGGVDVVPAEAVIEAEAVEEALLEGEAWDDPEAAALGGTGMGAAAENPIDEQRSKAAQRLIKYDLPNIFSRKFHQYR